MLVLVRKRVAESFTETLELWWEWLQARESSSRVLSLSLVFGPTRDGPEDERRFRIATRNPGPYSPHTRNARKQLEARPHTRDSGKRLEDFVKRRPHTRNTGHSLGPAAEWAGVDRQHGQQLQFGQRAGRAATAAAALRHADASDDPGLTGPDWRQIRTVLTSKPVHSFIQLAHVRIQLWRKVNNNNN